MNRLVVTVLLCAVSSLMTASPAHAWFGWLDRLSGPGPFWGARIDARLWCFMEQTAWTRAAVATQAAAAATQALATANLPSGAEPAAVLDPGVAVEGLSQAAAAWEGLANERTTARAEELRARAESFVKRLPDDSAWDGARALWTDVAEQWAAAADEKAVFLVPGIILNASCALQRGEGEPGRTRPLAYIDLGYQFLTARNDEYAGGERIYLHLLVPRISWRLLAPPYDFIDAGTGAGAYVFTSEGFDAFAGLVVEPLRFDLHGPPRWLDDENVLRRLAAAIHVSFGIVIFPGGFEADVFRGVGAANRAISGGEVVFQKGITFDLLGFLNRRAASPARAGEGPEGRPPWRR